MQTTFALLLLIPLTAAEPAATISVNAGDSGIQVARDMYGIFFEEINHAGDGGLYAELVQNRSFEDSRLPEGTALREGKAVTPGGFEVPHDVTNPLPAWSLRRTPGGQGTVELVTDRPVAPLNPHSARLELRDAGGGEVALVNDGYWGIPVEEDGEYRLSVHLRSDGAFEGPVRVRLEGESRAYSEATINGLSSEWSRYTRTLRSSGTDRKAKLAIVLDRPGVVWIDVVSLFPAKTWKGRTNGLRPDLAEMLAELAPGFVRFPGGCFVEGITLENAFHWKRTIGDIAERPGHWCLWHYMSTDGLGYHEYLQMCEDLDCPAMYVANCGMACQARRGGVATDEELNRWLQDALDAIEYARGPATTRWGGVRAKNGHPEPFDLKYVEIGNENSGATYERHYALFHAAIKSRYPEIITISNVPLRAEPVEIIDEHYYSSPEFFIANATRYDRYDREGPKIYVGEYACTQGCGQGNLRAAIGEAAFMAGMERNADVVVMASYAPLFVNVHDRRWNPDLIGFDNSRVYGTPSYHVQKLFGRNRPDVALPTRVVAPHRDAEDARGAVGLGTWDTQAEFKDLRVTRGGEVLLESDFSRGAEGWRAVRGEWSVVDGAYRQSARGDDLRALAGSPDWKDYTLSVKARKLGGSEGFLILFRAEGPDRFFWWNIGGWGNGQHAIERAEGSRQSAIGRAVAGRIETGRWYDIRIELDGSRIQCFLDDKRIHDLDVQPPSALYATAGRRNVSGELILKVVNVTETTRTADVRIEAGAAVGADGTAITLTSGDPDDENSVDEPRKVVPLERPLSGAGRRFSYEFPPYSLTVLRLPSKE